MPSLPHAHRPQHPRLWWGSALLSALFGLLWLIGVHRPLATTNPLPTDPLQLATVTQPSTVINGPIALTMNSTPFHYANEWQVEATGADPGEPADPWREPAGRLRFTYRGADLALLLATGDYWGYLYVTVDGAPANRLTNLAGNRTAAGMPAGYRTFYAPEAVNNGAPVPQWVPIHRAADPTAQHTVEIEVWRSWGQTPIRGVAVDTLPRPRGPQWPGVALLLVSGWLLVPALRATARLGSAPQWLQQGHQTLQRWLLPRGGHTLAPAIAGSGVLLIGVAITLAAWPATLLGLLLLGWAGLQRPTLWIAALLVGIPFYFSFTLPLLPGRALGLIDIGVLGGFVISAGHWLLQQSPRADATTPHVSHRSLQMIGLLLGGLVSWALLSTVEAAQQTVAWREWRTVFLYGGLFGATLWMATTSRPYTDAQRSADQTLLLLAWLAGSTIVALVALWQYGSGTLLIQAEGVERVRAFYGSPNNLALYLERTLAVLLAFALFTQSGRLRWLCLAASALQGVALLLTFSKGALLLGLPTILAFLWLGGFVLLGRRGETRHHLWWLAGIAVLAAVALLPFLATERFQRLLDFEGGTGFIRLQLWRSSWQMALDHPWLGVGPDNFLYAYRSIYLLPAAWEEPNLNHPHNWLLDWWTRLGLPGLFLALSWFGILLRQQWQHLGRGEQPVLALGLLAATTGALAHGLIDASYALPDLMLVWVLISYLTLVHGGGSKTVVQWDSETVRRWDGGTVGRWE